MSLKGANTQQLVETLSHTNMLWRQHAQRLLVESGDEDAIPALIDLAEDPSVDDIGINADAIHALWTLRGLGALDQPGTEAYDAAVGALQHPSAGVRANAVQVLPASEQSIQAIQNAGLLEDTDLNVRLRILVALADQPSTPQGRAGYLAGIAAGGEYVR